MINDSLLPHFPQNLGDTFKKSWITYKNLWFLFFSFMFLFHIPAALIFLTTGWFSRKNGIQVHRNSQTTLDI